MGRPSKLTPAKKAKRKTAPKKPPGRPSTYKPEVARAICERLSKGEPLAEICRDEGMPPVRTVSHWKEQRPEFLADFTRAREEGYDAIAADCLRIANTPERGKRVERNAKGEVVQEVEEDMLGHRKLQIETRLKLLAKWDPKRYGEKVAIGGAEDLPPLQTVTALSDEQLMAIAAGRAAKP